MENVPDFVHLVGETVNVTVKSLVNPPPLHVFDLPSSSLLASPAVRGSVEHNKQVQWSADGRALQDGHGDVFNKQ